MLRCCPLLFAILFVMPFVWQVMMTDYLRSFELKIQQRLLVSQEIIRLTTDRLMEQEADLMTRLEDVKKEMEDLETHLSEAKERLENMAEQIRFGEHTTTHLPTCGKQVAKMAKDLVVVHTGKAPNTPHQRTACEWFGLAVLAIATALLGARVEYHRPVYHWRRQ